MQKICKLLVIIFFAGCTNSNIETTKIAKKGTELQLKGISFEYSQNSTTPSVVYILFQIKNYDKRILLFNSRENPYIDSLRFGSFKMIFDKDTFILNTNSHELPLKLGYKDSLWVTAEMSYFYDTVRKKEFMAKYGERLTENKFDISKMIFLYQPYPKDYERFLKNNDYIFKESILIIPNKDSVSINHIHRPY